MSLQFTQEMMAAVRQVADRHKLHPATPDDCMTLVAALADVLMAIATVADPKVDGIVISMTDDGLGNLVTVHTPDGYLEVIPKETMQ